MQRELKVILVEDERELCEEFRRCFETVEGIELAAVTDSAAKALEYVRQMQPDAVILDLELHMGEGNGVTFLSKLGKLRGISKPYVLVNTNNSSRTTYDLVRRLGADFVMYKHQQGHCPEDIAEFLLTMARDRTEAPIKSEQDDEEELIGRSQLRARILDELDKVFISPKKKGYLYLADAIEICCGGYVPNVSALIGEKYGKTPKSVEHAMQNAIDGAWDNTDLNELEKHYKARYSANRLSPTVKEFICYYAAKIEKDA